VVLERGVATGQPISCVLFNSSTDWPEAAGACAVPFMGVSVRADGTVSLGRKKTRKLLRDIVARTWRVARSLPGVKPDDLRHTLPTKHRATRDRACSAFREIFPDGVVWVPGEPADALAGLCPRETRSLLIDASVFARDFYPNGRRSGFEVTAFCDGSDLQSVFVVGRGSNLKARRHWRSLIRRINLDVAMGPPGQTKEGCVARS
jgi:hypothetical protein